MSDSPIPTIEELARRREHSLMTSAQAAARHPEIYHQLKKLVREITSKPIEIDDYYSMARDLAELLKQMTKCGHGSIFQYFYSQIDPHQKGQAQYFRANCIDLEEQLRCIDHLRQTQSNLRVIQ